MKQRILTWIGMMTLMSLLVLPLAHAKLEYVQGNSPRMMQGARPNGMGGAFIAVKGSDSNAMFYNPASINDYGVVPKFQFLLPTAEISSGAIDYAINQVPDFADEVDAESTDSGKVDAFDRFVTANSGRYFGAGVNGSAVAVMSKYITASLFYNGEGVVGLTNPMSSTLDIETVTQGGVMLGSSYSFFDDQVQLGAGVKFAERHVIDEKITSREIVNNADFGDILDLDNHGFGVGVDLGAKYTPEFEMTAIKMLKPSFAFTVQDLGHTRFSNGVEKQRQAISVGTALSPKVGPFETLWALDVRDINHETDLMRKVHIGTEWRLPVGFASVAARLGMYQKYLSAGVGADIKIFKIDFATYAKALSPNSTNEALRMYMVQLGAGF